MQITGLEYLWWHLHLFPVLHLVLQLFKTYSLRSNLPYFLGRQTRHTGWKGVEINRNEAFRLVAISELNCDLCGAAAYLKSVGCMQFMYILKLWFYDKRWCFCVFLCCSLMKKIVMVLFDNQPFCREFNKRLVTFSCICVKAWSLSQEVVSLS